MSDPQARPDGGGFAEDGRADPGARPRRKRFRRPNVRRAAPALPNGLTLGNLFFGIFAIISASRGNFDTAVKCIVAGGACDAFDGAVARATHTGGAFGEELDSLVDAISFGFAPAMIVYFAVLPRDGWAWLPVFIFAACAVIRLARFNVTQAGEKKTYFIGLPSPAAGGTVATYYWFTQTTLYQNTRIVDLPWQEIMPALMLLLAAMMISSVPYPTWPKVGVKSAGAIGGLALVLGILVGTLFFPKYFLFLFGVGYLAFGLLRAVVLGLLDLPAGEGRPRRRASDYVDPMEAYGTPPLDPALVDGSADDLRRARRRRRLRERPRDGDST